jgi:hypothetical protein
MTQFDKPIEHERQSLRPMEAEIQPQQRPVRRSPPGIFGKYGFSPYGSIYVKEKYTKDMERWNKEKQRRREASPELAQALDDIAMGVIDPGSKPTGVAKGAKSLLRKFAPGSDKWIEAYLKGIKESGEKWSKESKEQILDHLNRRTAARFDPPHLKSKYGPLRYWEGHQWRPGTAIKKVPLALDEALQRETTNIAEWTAKPGPLRHMGLDPSGATVDTMRKHDVYMKKTLPEKYKTSLLEADQETYEKMAGDANQHLMDLIMEQPKLPPSVFRARKQELDELRKKLGLDN